MLFEVLHNFSFERSVLQTLMHTFILELESKHDMKIMIIEIYKTALIK